MNGNYSSFVSGALSGTENNNEQIKTERQKVVEDYVIDINNKLVELVDYLHLDLPEIKVINKKNYGSNPFNDEQKKSIITAVKLSEQIEDEERKEVFKREAMEAAGITKDEEQDNAINRMKRLAGINRDVFKGKSTPKKEDLEDFKSRLMQRGRYKAEFQDEVVSLGQAPPKTDWSRIDVPKDEKNKIIESIRANPKSSVFSKEFKWEPKEFLEAFKYLEESKKYNGPFIVSIVDNKPELEKYSKIRKLSEGIEQIYLGKYVLLSVYDITTSSKEAKYIYIGLKYIGMTGRLEFDSMGSIVGHVKKSQRKIVMEYMDAMDIIYKTNHEDLKLS